VEHAEAHEWLSDLALEPRRLEALAHDPSPETSEIRRHLASCEECAADVAEWRRTWAEIGAALDTDVAEHLVGEPGGWLGDADEPATDAVLRPPAELRDRILAAATAKPALEVAPWPPRQRHRPRIARSWLITAAAVLVAAVAGTNSYLRTAELDRLHVENAALAVATSTLDHVLAADRYWTVTLRTADGQPGGTLAWSSTDVVVLTSALPAPAPGQGYRCWLERDGSRRPMGWMSFSRSTGFWTASMTDYGTGALLPGGRFGISLTPASGAGTPILVGEL
jgi:hypothetical protein